MGDDIAGCYADLRGEVVSEAFSDPLVLAILGLVGGYFLNEFRRGREDNTSSKVSDAAFMARLKQVEDWQRDHNTIHGCVQRLAATSEGMAKNVDRLTRRIDMFMSYFPIPKQPPRRSPFDFPSAREWALEDEADT